MKRFAHLALCLFAAVGLVLAFDLATYATDGSSLILGRVNHAQSPTVLSSVKGPALRLKTKSSTTAPLAVSNKTKVTRLNADLVDGKDAATLANDTRRYTFSSAEVQHSPDFVIPHVPTGTYLATVSTNLLPNAGSADSPRNAQCELALGEKKLGGDEGVYTGQFAVLLSAADVITLKKPTDVSVLCDTNGTGDFTFYLPLVVTLTTTHLVSDGPLGGVL